MFIVVEDYWSLVDQRQRANKTVGSNTSESIKYLTGRFVGNAFKIVAGVEHDTSDTSSSSSVSVSVGVPTRITITDSESDSDDVASVNDNVNELVLPGALEDWKLLQTNHVGSPHPDLDISDYQLPWPPTHTNTDSCLRFLHFEG